MEDILMVANIFIRELRPKNLSEPVKTMLSCMTKFEDLVTFADSFTPESIPKISETIFEDGQVTWGRLLAVVWVGVHVKGLYPDKSDEVFDIVVDELFKRKEWILGQQSFSTRLMSYVKSFFYNNDEHDEYNFCKES